jgi:O-antigen ligase
MSGPKLLATQSTVTGAALVAAFLVGSLAVTNGAAVLSLPLILVGGVVLFMRPVLGLFVIAALIPLESALMIGGRSFAALVGMAVFGIWAAQKLLRREPLTHLVSSGFVQLALLLFTLACMSILWAQSPQVMQRPLFQLFQLILLSVLVLDLTTSWDRAAGVAKLLVLAGTLAALLTVEQYFVGGVRRAGGGVAGGINRTAATLVTILPFAFYLWRSREAAPWRLLGLGFIALSAIAVSATLSRMNFLLFPLVVMVHLALMARTRGERRRVFVLGAVAVLTVSFMPMDAVRHRADSIVPYLVGTVGVERVSEEDYRATYTARSFFMRMGVEMFKDRPLIGSGFANYQPQTHLYQWRVPRSPYEWVPEGRSPHSSHVAILVGLGIVGFLLWLGLFGVALYYAWKAWRADEDPTSGRVLFSQAVGVAVALQFVYGFYGEVHYDKIMWVVLGLAVAIHRLSALRGSRSEADLRLAREFTE